MRAVLRYGRIAIYTSSATYIILVGKFSTHYMRDVRRYGVIIYHGTYTHPGAVVTIGTLNFDNYSSQSHSCFHNASKLSA